MKGRAEGERDPLALMPPLISTGVTLLGALVVGWLAFLTPVLFDHDSNRTRMVERYEVGLAVSACGLVVPLAMLVISWVLPWRRHHRGSRVAAAVLAPVLLGVLYVLVLVLTFGL
ncbi:hypothetical protein [Streptomyces sp. 769]|uniref:hypothetical protein n=1 Tax=Streptomyces sp. 769 TaxID=1262452 RepID=UPI00131AD83F|nr:hypothetical protein [Streptomyces sp. 769]